MWCNDLAVDVLSGLPIVHDVGQSHVGVFGVVNEAYVLAVTLKEPTGCSIVNA